MDAFVTLLSTESYLEAVLVLNQSLKNVNSDYPLVCMVTDNLNIERIKKILESQDIIVEVVKNIEYSKRLQEIVLTEIPQFAHTLYTGSKFGIFYLPQEKYNKLVFIDVDVMVLQNMDDIMSYPDGSMLYVDNENLSQLFVIELSNHKEQEYYETLLEYGRFNDGAILGFLWFFVRSNPDYQIPSLFQDFYMNGGINIPTAKSIHFQGPWKPWIHIDKYNAECPIFQLYTSLVNDARAIIAKYEGGLL